MQLLSQSFVMHDSCVFYILCVYQSLIVTICHWTDHTVCCVVIVCCEQMSSWCRNVSRCGTADCCRRRISVVAVMCLDKTVSVWQHASSDWTMACAISTVAIWGHRWCEHKLSSGTHSAWKLIFLFVYTASFPLLRLNSIISASEVYPRLLFTAVICRGHLDISLCVSLDFGNNLPYI